RLRPVPSGSLLHECTSFHPFAQRPHDRRRHGRDRPALRLELEPAAGGFRHRVDPVGDIPRDPGLPDPVAADARRRRRAALSLTGWRAGRVVLGAAWPLHTTVAGLGLGCAGLAAGARLRGQGPELALVFNRYPWGPGGALTLGNVILNTGPALEVRCRTYACRAGWGAAPMVVLADHERAHVLQYMVLGPLFLPVDRKSTRLNSSH